ncbi:flagellar biosynthesis anti-sigma factor FlgM [Pantoea agglomerans]|jgi:negative regulator of flagellin synthesis FlgM|uniref:Negative regulator of flagellin synthesis n=2 Tax=Pantoea TaxID=53335 RepID=A0A349IIC2_ENTAG|nr:MULTISPECIES: flagellar biosynthesis anti-sigma factor FlgM [Pantoea]MDF9910064.1 negative regulator of flagellin synthesis FlgM [Pantoea brenneri]AOE40886.1 flagellar biosynthesis anti-sigma factor FlgM [Pantoea agglomerans]ERM07368.1 anti-sigma28 factor FlgM [Pantoea agglomerans Tx10]EZI33868.1 Anti-sigma28 factor FlgM [Pantoea agglomerans]KAF6639680.1 anti-sigma-28 factor FlgM [Pantoea sp. EKM10T]
MSIDRTQPLKPASTVQSRDSSESGSSKVRQSASPVAAATTPAAAQVSLSSAQSQLMQPSSKDINVERVEQLKTAIRNGELKMDTGKIADALIADTKAYLEGN